jgi:two-component system sensor histidine kinase KdpD
MDAIASLVALALERARLLNEIGVKDALKKSDELKSALLACVSHNLRTPLTSIRASIESILAAEADGGTPALREFHLIISEEVNRLTRIVDHLLEMARVEAGELRLRKEWTSVSEILDNALQSCAAAVRDHKIRVDCAETLPLIKVDPRMLTEVLTNLIENAAKYSPAGSEIALRAGVGGDSLRISITDHGPGIASEEAQRVFNKFYRGTQPNHQMQEGTGMGLAISRGLVEAHSGKIWVESIPGSGATFVFTVPVEQTVPVNSTLEMNKP